jgi:hypothetical protein
VGEQDRSAGLADTRIATTEHLSEKEAVTVIDGPQPSRGVVRSYLHELADATLRGWDRFWFTPADPATYCLIRIFAGLMLFYTHLVWTLDLVAFFGPTPWLSVEALRQSMPPGVQSYAWSYLFYVQSPWLLWTLHIAALIALAMFALGLFSRVTSVLAFVITVSYCNRVPAALFGLDQINSMLALYLMIGPSGACFSLDRLLARKGVGSLFRAGSAPLTEPAALAHEKGSQPPLSVTANIGIRLIQLHMCVVYLSAGLGKLQGISWWDGTAMWLSVANLEYQSIDMTWLAHYPLLLNLLTHITIAWEVSYAVFIWPRLTRPIVLALAIPLHLGIACFLGMITFGLVMLIANLAFVSPSLLRARRL